MVYTTNMGSNRNRNRHKHEHRHLTDLEAQTIARSMQAEEGECYMCFHQFVQGDQITSTLLPKVGLINICTPCTHDLKDSLRSAGVTVPSIGESLRNERHEVSYDGKDFIYRG